MKALVTGSNGFIGSFLVESLLARGDAVRCLVRRTSNLRWIKDLNVERVIGELRNPESLQQAVDGVDVIYHLAGVTRGRTEQDYLDGNYVSTVNLLQAAKYSSTLKKFVFVSSQAAAGPSINDRPRTEADPAEPISLYGRAKARAEDAVLQYGDRFPVTVIRPPAVYGPRDKDFFVMFQHVNRGILPILGAGTQQVSLVHVDDLVNGIVLAADAQDADGKIYFISEGDYSWLDVGQAMAGALGKKTLKLHLPLGGVAFVSWFTIAYSNLTRKAVLLNRDKILEMKQAAWICSGDRARTELGFSPKMNLQTGMQQTAAWYRQQGWLK